MNGLHPLRPFQIDALDRLKASVLAKKRRPLLCLPTGSGKTVIGARIVAGALSKGNRVAFIVPMINLIDQTMARFAENGISYGDMGVMQADHEWFRPHAPIQICSAQTLARRGMPEGLSVVVVDECHVSNTALHGWLEENRSVLAIGLSATPYAKGLGLVYDDLICPVTMKELIDGGYLSNFRVFAPTHPDLSGVKIDAKSGDYQTGELSSCMSKPRLVADIVGNWLEKGENRPTLCFAVDRAHAAVLHDQFEANGVSSAYVDANTPREDRLELAARFTRGEIKVICNIGTMTTGVDLDVRCIIFARPTKSESMFVQIIGRGLRMAPGKAEDGGCVIFDHSDTHLRLGMVTDISIDELDTGKPGAGDAKKKQKLDPLPKECPHCQCLIPAMAQECPNCGHVSKRVSSVVQDDGELVELGSKKRKGAKETSAQRLAKMPKAELFGQIRQVQKDRKWSDGRAANCYRNITGAWPNNVRGAALRDPSMELLAFIRHKDMAYAKAKSSSHAKMMEALQHGV